MKKVILLFLVLVFVTLTYAAQHDYNPSDSPAATAYNSNTYTELGWTDINVTETDVVTDVVVDYTWDTDSWASEGSFHLESPAGTSVQIASGEADGTYSHTLTDFSGETMNGTWKLWIQDSYGDGGHQATNITVSFHYAQAGAPGVVTNPNPANNATDVAINGNLTWDFGSDTSTYDLWFGPAGNMTQVVTDAAAGATGSYAYSNLDYFTKYEWKVVSKNTNTRLTTEGPVWSFTTLFNGVSIGNGTATNQHLPIEPYYGYSYSQTIYKASDFSGVGSNKRIKKIYYNYHWNGGDPDCDDWVVYMGTTTQDTISDWFPVSGLTEVYNGHLQLENLSGDGWLEIALDTPFNYDPSTDGNLIIAVDENTSGYTTSSDDFYCDQDTAYVSIRYYSDSTNPDPASPPTGTREIYYPNTKFLIEDIPAHPEPTGLVVSNIGVSSASLDWTENGTATHWDIEYGTAGFAQGSGTMISNTSTKPYTITGLSPNTSYDWYVRSNYGLGGSSAWSNKGTFTTSAGAQNPTPADGATNVALTATTLDWDDVLDADNYTISIGTTSGGTDVVNGALCNTSQYTYTSNWDPQTTYYWTVTTNYTTRASVAGPEWTFTTQCNPVTTFPFEENFDGETSIPMCWTMTTNSAQGWFVTNDGSSQYWTIPEGDSTYACSNDDAANDDGSMDYLITPALDLSGMSGVVLSFTHYYTGAYSEMAYVEVSTDMQNWTKIDSMEAVSDWTPVQINLSAYAGSTIYIAFHADDTGHWASGWAIDNVVVKEANQHDVTVYSQSMNEVCDTTPFTPQAVVKNIGVNTETFDVTMNINGRWSSTKTVTALAPFTETTVTFDTWTPAEGTLYDIQVFSALATDEDTSNDSLNASTLALNLDKTVYANDAQGGNLVSFNMKDPGTFTTLSSESCTDFYAAMTFVDTLMRAFEYGGNGNRNIWTIKKDGTQTVDTTYTASSLHGIAYNPNTRSTVYAASGDSLYTIDLATGICTAIGAFGTGGFMIGIAYDQAHNILYGIDLGTDKLYTINTATGAATEVGPLGIDINFAQDCAFDQENGYLMLAGYSTSGILYYIDTTTGAARKVGDFEDGHELTGFAIPYPMTVSSPANVTISVSGGNANLSWDAVSGASIYSIYGATTPYGTYSLIQTGVTSTTWSEPVSGTMKFYQVTAATTRTYHHTNVDIVPAVKNTIKLFRYNSNDIFKK